jgi:hypothetical protein
MKLYYVEVYVGKGQIESYYAFDYGFHVVDQPLGKLDKDNHMITWRNNFSNPFVTNSFKDFLNELGDLGQVKYVRCL